ncbi:MAG: hypothetical protein ABIJ18_03270 [archaeon]
MAKNNDSLDVTAVIIILVGIISVCYIWWERNGQEIEASFLAIPWVKIGIIILLTLISIFIVYKTIKYIEKRKKEKQRTEERIENEKNTLLSLLNTDFQGNSREIEEQYKKINKRIKEINKNIRNQYQKEIKSLHKKTKNLIQTIEQQEYIRYERQLEQEREEELKRKRHKNKVKELFEYKKKLNSIRALPLNKKYSSDVINEATKLMKYYEHKQGQLNETRENAIEYYKTHPLDTQPEIRENEEKLYKEVRDQIKQGKIELKKKPKIEYQGKKLEKDFYLSKDLNEETKAKARAQGFVQVDGIKLDGKIQGGGYYIRKENPRESKKHFYLKHLFAKLHENTQLEYQVKGKRVDVVLLIEDYKLGIEIETGANREKQLMEKISWLNKNFDQWIFVCPKELHGKYNKLVNPKKSFCLGIKEAKEFILELTLPVEDLQRTGK